MGTLGTPVEKLSSFGDYFVHSVYTVLFVCPLLGSLSSFVVSFTSPAFSQFSSQVVHCDLAARNVLIAEGFVLKIGDFGMALETSSKECNRKHSQVSSSACVDSPSPL